MPPPIAWSSRHNARALLALALAAREHGLNTGILWELSDAQAAAVNAALAARDLSANVGLGVDPTRVQPVGISLTDVKKGARPAFGARPAPHAPSRVETGHGSDWVSRCALNRQREAP